MLGGKRARILNGETNGVSYVGSYPPSSYQTANVPHVVVYEKLTPGTMYDAYCSSSELSAAGLISPCPSILI